MAQTPGFLDKLGVGTADEADAVEAARVERLNRFNQNVQARAQAAAPGLGGLIGGVQGLITGQADGRSVRGFLGNAAQSATNVADDIAARGAGITVEQLKGRREMRTAEVADTGDGSFSNRRAALQRIINIANRTGDMDVLGNALRELSALKKEETEWEKLVVEKKQAEAELVDETTENAIWNGKDVTGTEIQFADGSRGLMFEHEGQMKREKWGPNLYQADGSREPIGKVINRSFTAKQRGEFEATLKNAAENQRKIRRTMKFLIKATKAGDVGLMLGTPQKAVPLAQGVFTDVKNYAQGFMRLLDDSGTNTTERQNREKAHTNFVEGGGKFMWRSGNEYNTPDWLRGADSNARQFRANILELAYIAARMREPSNRGLSDKDIETAMQTLTADARNPQDIMQRFAQMVGDADYQVQLALDSIDGRVDGVSNEEVLRHLSGGLYERYLSDREGLRQEVGLSIDANGIGIFDELLGVEGSATAQPDDDTDVLAPPERDVLYMEDVLVEESDGETSVSVSDIEDLLKTQDDQ
jgi:hypothetical protein